MTFTYTCIYIYAYITLHDMILHYIILYHIVMYIYTLYYVDCRNPQKKCCFQCFQDAELCDDVSQLFHPFGGCYTETPPKTKVKKEMMLKNIFLKNGVKRNGRVYTHLSIHLQYGSKKYTGVLFIFPPFIRNLASSSAAKAH